MASKINRPKTIWFSRSLFMLPVGILFIFFFIYPLIFTAFTSFTNWSGIGAMKFNGLSNYSKLFHDSVFLLGLKNNLIWALAQGLIQVPLAAVAAIILVHKPKGWRSFRTIYFLPNVISTVAIAMMWVALYNPQFGLFPGKNILGNPNTALVAIIFQAVIYIGYFMIIILAAAMNIPVELYEAAEIDGASIFQQDWRITIPMLRGTLVTSITLAMAYGMRHFEATFLMTKGGPAYSTTTMGINLYLKMESLHYAEASAIGIVLIILGSVLISLIRKLAGTDDPMSDASQ